jgi:hypothetical protein
LIQKSPFEFPAPGEDAGDEGEGDEGDETQGEGGVDTDEEATSDDSLFGNLE